ncbi:sensor histidine kinase [Extibacter muris]|uniref:sensor histidine kinase n=1 Tax=Extibacter muris TaxID=1796622 RepID=UPI001D05EA6D|nr:sensor histidine kinase [Extibacter muris]MCB6200808.1 sensor histidine kinase [Extibacter muris]MCQ4662139.1 sensor histidine kinase [Extibacter muris]MCQ4691948.1 sensor histidine kinase [Extibacter muris]
MMTEISLNVLDVAENSIRAGADYITIEVLISTEADTLTVVIDDNGCGMDEEQVKRVTDPFYTTRTTRKVGLGIPFFKQAAESTGGRFGITSGKGIGTRVEAVFGLSHIDRMPLGDINTTMHTLIVFNEPVDFHYRYAYDEKEFVLDTKEMKEILGGVSFKDAEVSGFIKEYLDANKEETDDGKSV